MSPHKTGPGDLFIPGLGLTR